MRPLAFPFFSLSFFGVFLGTGLLFGESSKAPLTFNRDIRPILSDACFSCHGPDAQKVKGGLRLDQREAALQPAKSGKTALVPNHPESSEIMRRLLTSDPDEQMPPPESHKVLTADQKSLLQRWIAEGAVYQGHWAYTPPVRPKVPAGVGAVDALILQPLKARGLRPSPEADRRILARRLYWDLIGVPPSPEMVSRFESDREPGAYERLVDRLMASPQYGERMAIGWLDLVRFADTIGYHSDVPRNIWPYRDYVIRAFNANFPFDRFTVEQLAGDLLPHPTQDQLVASGFNRLLLTTEEGGAQEKDYESRYLTDRVRAVGTVWLGQTLGCAQCHDHKFDPIRARDFYSMGAFFADVKEGIIAAREPGMLVPDEIQGKALKQLTDEAGRAGSAFEAPHPEFDAAFEKWQRENLSALESEALWIARVPESVRALNGTQWTVREDRSILASGPKPDTETVVLVLAGLAEGVKGLRLEVLPDKSLPSKGPGRSGNGNFVLTEVLARVVKEGKEVRRLPFATAWANHEQSTLVEQNPYRLWSAASVIDGDVKGVFAGWAILPNAGQAAELRLGFRDGVALEVGESLEIELQQNHGHGAHTLGCFRLSTSTDSRGLKPILWPLLPKEIAEKLQVPAAKRTPAQQTALRDKFKLEAPEFAALRKQKADAEKAVADFEKSLPRTLITQRTDKPRTVRILPRGNWMIETGEVIEPALPGYLKTAGRTEGGRRLNRLDLAQWVVSPENPLTARVVVNRFWKQFFGIGLSKVLDDFGAQGEPPRNPELLDWLAVEFRESGWDVKHLVRTLVLSQAYRQVSTASREEVARDPENRDLGRQNRWRLDAELVRDTAVSFSGLLVTQIGGPSARPYQPDGYWENLNFPQRAYQASAGSDQYRRGVYTWWQRSFMHPSMLAFDAATREECAAERNRSNIPQQALVLLNDPSYVEAARMFALRILTEGGEDDRSRLIWAWRRALARDPSREELATLGQLLQTQQTSFAKDPAAATRYAGFGGAAIPAGIDAARLAAWTDIARTVLNLHETITRS